jgi:TolB protein
MNTDRIAPIFGFTLTSSILLITISGCSSTNDWSSTDSATSGVNSSDFQMTSTSGFYGETDAMFWVDGEDEGQGSVSQITFASEGSDFDPEVDATGSFLIYASTQHSTQSDIYRKMVDGKTITRMTFDPADDAMPTISPDGRWIAFASNRSGNWDIWMMPSDGGAATQMTFDDDHELHPSFSPDGTELTYCRRNSRSNHWEIWSYTINSPGMRTYVCDGLFPQWSPDTDASTLLFQKARQRGSQFFSIWTVQFKDGACSNPTEITSASDAAIMHPSWSPDGKLICYCQVANPQGNSAAWPIQADVWMVSLDGSGQAPLTTGSFRNMQPNWSKDGRIYFVSDRGGEDVIWSIPAATSTTPDMPMEVFVDATTPLDGE